MSNLKRSARTFAALGMVVLTLAACKSTPQTAYQLMQEQQELQAQARQAEDDAARKAMPSQPEMFLSLIAQSMEQGRHFAALAYVDAYIQQYGNTPEIAPLRANALRMTGQDAASEEVYRKLVTSGKAAEGWHGLGLLAGARGDFAAAADNLGKASRLRPTDADMLSDLGYARLRAGDIAGARLPLGQAAELNPASTKVIANLALLLLVEGETDRAARVMDQANMSEQARAQLISLAQSTRMPAVPVSMDAAPVQTVAAHGDVSRSAEKNTSQPAMDTPVAPDATQARTTETGSATSTPRGETVRFVDAGDTPSVSSARTAPEVSGPAAVVAAQARPRIASTQPVEVGMHSPFMNFLGNTPLVR